MDSIHTQVRVVGLKHHGFGGVSPHIHEDLDLGFEREPRNNHDPNAIAVSFEWCGTSVMIGYIAKSDAEEIAPLLDGGAKLKLRCLDTPKKTSAFLRAEFYGAPAIPTPKRQRSAPRDRIEVWL